MKNSKTQNKNSSTQAKTTMIALVGLVIGAGVGAYLQHSTLEIVAPESVIEQKKRVSKKEIINEILAISGIDKVVFSETAIPQIKGTLIQKMPTEELLAQDSFWISLEKDQKENIDRVNAQYTKLSYYFYEQFNEEELEKYLSLKKLPINLKVQSILIESAKEASRDQESLDQLTSLVYKYLAEKGSEYGYTVNK